MGCVDELGGILAGDLVPGLRANVVDERIDHAGGGRIVSLVCAV